MPTFMLALPLTPALRAPAPAHRRWREPASERSIGRSSERRGAQQRERCTGQHRSGTDKENGWVLMVGSGEIYVSKARPVLLAGEVDSGARGVERGMIASRRCITRNPGKQSKKPPRQRRNGLHRLAPQGGGGGARLRDQPRGELSNGRPSALLQQARCVADDQMLHGIRVGPLRPCSQAVS